MNICCTAGHYVYDLVCANPYEHSQALLHVMACYIIVYLVAKMLIGLPSCTSHSDLDTFCKVLFYYYTGSLLLLQEVCGLD